MHTAQCSVHGGAITALVMCHCQSSKFYTVYIRRFLVNVCTICVHSDAAFCQITLTSYYYYKPVLL